MENSWAFRIMYWRFMPHFLLIFVQSSFSLLYFVTEAAFKHGLNPHVYVTYRYVLGCLLVLPFACFLERKVRPKMTLLLFLEIFVLSLLGASLTLNMYFASLKYTNPTFVTSMTNAIPSMTFLFAVILRLEVINVRTPRGVAKIVGTLMSLAGALVLAFYKGPKMKSLQGAPIHIRSSHVQQNWMKGSFLLLASCITWSLWFILQVYTLRKYPAQLSLTAWINFLGGAQSAVFTLFIQHKPEAWAIKIDINFWCILYAGVVICAVTVFVQLWCTKQKGPVFVTMFSPLSTILVTILAYFLFGEELRTGSLVGGGIVIIGLYLLLLGKEGDQDRTKSNEQSFPIHDQEKDLKIQMETSAQREAAHQDPEK
ncbi:WAT1-related protein At4g08300 [Ricinus communis]|uniref:WAT1-related protein n=1 Tax=Ricinus communis TaxID=3988 RepID=B9T2A3_RICCO|nr:WAT1-related protein At4g08300 [Ricinus communis]EEF30015.1 Auxin-induced protein 5NG4, putative [Ricinus communis]|eukprot:XP_002532372.1 WAT1-related protein At4g08300 isoform X2 [Ricinus communis]